MPTVYGALGSPFVRKVLVALAEKGIAYDLEQVIPFGAPPEFRKISPLGRIPAFRDGDRTLADSSIIIAYLERTKPQPALYPTDAYEYARALWFEEYGDGGLAPVFGTKIFFPRIIGPRFFNRPPDEEAIKKTLEEEVPPMLAYLEGELGNNQFLVGGKFSIADIGIAAQFVNFQYAGCSVDATRYPKLCAYLARILERPSFKDVIAKERAALGIK